MPSETAWHCGTPWWSRGLLLQPQLLSHRHQLLLSQQSINRPCTDKTVCHHATLMFPTCHPRNFMRILMASGRWGLRIQVWLSEIQREKVVHLSRTTHVHLD